MARAGVAHAVARAVDFEVGLDRNDDEVVLRLAEDGAFGLGHADDLERKALHLDGLSDGVAVPGRTCRAMSLPMKATLMWRSFSTVGDEAAVRRFVFRMTPMLGEAP